MDEEADAITAFFEGLGVIESCRQRTYLDKAAKEHKFKGSCFIIFKEIEDCKKFVEDEEVKYKDTPLVRKWQADYLQEKKLEIEERKKSRNEKRQKQEVEKNEKKMEFPKGAVMHFSGILEGQSLTRENLKEHIAKSDTGVEVAFIDFNKGDLEGYIRFTKENAAIDYHKSLTDGKFEVNDISMVTKVLEGEEEDAFLKKSLESISKMRMKNKQSSRGKKRKGNFGGYGGPRSKQQK